MVEVHQEPDRALSDGKQSLTLDNYQLLIRQLQELARLEQKIIDR